MKVRSKLTSALVVLLSLTFALCAGEASAQKLVLPEKGPQVTKPVKEVSPVTQKAGKRVAMPDLASPSTTISVVREDSPQGPFAGECNCCFKQGYMLMKRASGYIRNAGNGPAPACKAELTWVDRGGAARAKVIDIPALGAGAHVIISAVFEQDQPFSVAHPVTLTIDHLNQVVEANENNNVLTFDFERFREEHSYQFSNCQ